MKLVDDGVTITEIHSVTGIGKERLRTEMARLIKNGKVRALHTRRPRMDGIMAWVPAYQLITEHDTISTNGNVSLGDGASGGGTGHFAS